MMIVDILACFDWTRHQNINGIKIRGIIGHIKSIFIILPLHYPVELHIKNWHFSMFWQAKISSASQWRHNQGK